jgi:GntR family transcriptional regulator
MRFSETDTTPLFEQVARQVADLIMTGSVREGERVPSTTEISSAYRINPATVLKGMNLLVDQGCLVKRRGLGLFVAPGARERLRHDLLGSELEKTLARLIDQARLAGMDEGDLVGRVRDAYRKDMPDEASAPTSANRSSDGKAEDDEHQRARHE